MVIRESVCGGGRRVIMWEGLEMKRRMDEYSWK